MNDVRTRAQILFIFFASPVILMGVQLITPALPVMQRELGLSDSEIALVTSVYLFPSIIFAFVSGLLADRFGRRRVYAAALTIFGLAGLGLTLVDNFAVILAIRLVQGAAFAAVAPLSITMIGDLLTGAEQVTAQSRRVFVLSVADTLFPIIGGLLVGLSWHAPFAVHITTIPMAIVALYLLPRKTKKSYSTVPHLQELFRVMRDPMALALEIAGFLRFFFRLAFLSYLPILLVTYRGMEPAFAGFLLGCTALFRTLAVLASGWVVRRVAPSRILALTFVLVSVAFVIVALFGYSLVPLVLAAIAFGTADGFSGVLQNSATTQVTSPDLRATFVAAIGSIRNLGKFLAPTLIGLAVLVVSLEVAFLAMAAFAVLALFTVTPLKRLDTQLGGGEVAGAAT